MCPSFSSLNVIQMALSIPFNSEDTNVSAKEITKHFTNGRLFDISQDEDDLYSFGGLDLTSEDVIDDKVMHGVIGNILLHPFFF